jgi:hypothetical protein
MVDLKRGPDKTVNIGHTSVDSFFHQSLLCQVLATMAAAQGGTSPWLAGQRSALGAPLRPRSRSPQVFCLSPV